MNTASVGRVLSDRYRIESALGAGSSAQVYAAWDVTLARRVAVKVLHPGLAQDATFLRRFRSEARAAAALVDPNVVPVFDWGEDGGVPYLVMPYCGGGSLQAMLDRGTRLDVPQAVAVGYQAARGLAYAHRRGFVHRDVKPANLLFDETGRIQVADFGLARALSEASWTEPEGATVGTARYSSPEQARGIRVDGQADVYALALTLYEAVTGTVPFGSDTVLGTLMARVDQVLPEHDGLGPLFPVLQAAAAPDPAERLDAARLAGALEALARSLPEPRPLVLPGTAATGLEEDPIGRTQHAGWGGEATAVAGPAEAMGFDHGTAQHPVVTPDAERRLPGHYRRQARRHSSMILAAAVALGVALLALLVAQQAGLFKPMESVPALVGLTHDQATQAASSSHLSISVTGRQESATIPAGGIVSQSPTPSSKLREGSSISVVLSSGPPPIPVPDLTTVTGGCAQAGQVLQQHDLQLGACMPQYSATVPQNAVMDWSPKGNVPPQSKVSVTFSQGQAPVTLPDLSGATTCAQVQSVLQQANFQVQCSLAASPTVPAGSVISENPNGQAVPGSTIIVQISSGTQVPVPKLKHMSVQQAQQVLQQDGLGLGPVYGSPTGQVVATTPAEGTLVDPGTPVTFVAF